MFYTTNLHLDSAEVGGGGDMSYLSDELVFKLTLIILMTIETLKSSKRLNTNLGLNSSHARLSSSIYFTSIAFALVFFSHIVNHTIIRLQETLLSLSKKSKPLINSNSLEEDEEDEREEEKKKLLPPPPSTVSPPESNLVSREKPKKKLRLIFGLRRRKHNSDSDTNDEDDSDDNQVSSDLNNSQEFNEGEEEDDEEGTLIQSSSGGSSSGRHRRIQRKRNRVKKRVKNIAQFVDRENLSETELNTRQSENSDSEPESPMQLQPQPATLPLVTEPSSNSSSETCKTIRADQDEQINAAPTITDTDFFQMNHLNNSSSVNFKEFSSQLISQHFSQIQPTTQLTHDEFIENEMYIKI
jgi:hypothetical protein